MEAVRRRSLPELLDFGHRPGLRRFCCVIVFGDLVTGPLHQSDYVPGERTLVHVGLNHRAQRGQGGADHDRLDSGGDRGQLARGAHRRPVRAIRPARTRADRGV